MEALTLLSESVTDWVHGEHTRGRELAWDIRVGTAKRHYYAEVRVDGLLAVCIRARSLDGALWDARVRFAEWAAAEARMATV